MANYKVTLHTGLVWTWSITVEAMNEQEALDMVADYVVENNFDGLWTDFYTLSDEKGDDETVDEYAEANGLVCCGNNGIYLMPLNIEEV